MARATPGRRPKRPRPAAPGGARAAAPDDAPALPASPAADGAPLSIRPRRTAPRKAAVAREDRSRLYRLTHPQFVRDILAELRKVVWPSRAETRSLTMVVLIVAVSVGALLGVVDWGFSRFMENVLLP